MVIYPAPLLYFSLADAHSPRLQPYVGWGARPKVCRRPHVVLNKMTHPVNVSGRRFLIATTGIINGNILMDAFGGVPVKS